MSHNLPSSGTSRSERPIGIIVLLVIGTSWISVSLTSATANTPPAYIEIRAVQNYGKWVAPSETTAGVLTMITNLRSSVANRPLNMYAIVSGPQSPTEAVG